MSWRPHISIWKSKNGSPISPTTSVGFGIAGILFVAMIGAGVLLVLRRELIGIVPVILGAAFFKDVWAWFAAAPKERTEFLDQVSAARNSVPLSLRNPTIPGDLMMASGATLACLVAGLSMLRLRGESQVLAMVGALYVGGFSILCWRDVLRSRRSRRGP